MAARRRPEARRRPARAARRSSRRRPAGSSPENGSSRTRTSGAKRARRRAGPAAGCPGSGSALVVGASARPNRSSQGPRVPGVPRPTCRAARRGRRAARRRASWGRGRAPRACTRSAAGLERQGTPANRTSPASASSTRARCAWWSSCPRRCARRTRTARRPGSRSGLERDDVAVALRDVVDLQDPVSGHVTPGASPRGLLDARHRTRARPELPEPHADPRGQAWPNRGSSGNAVVAAARTRSCPGTVAIDLDEAQEVAVGVAGRPTAPRPMSSAISR